MQVWDTVKVKESGRAGVVTAYSEGLMEVRLDATDTEAEETVQVHEQETEFLGR